MRALLSALLAVAAVTAAADIEVSSPHLQRRAESQFDVSLASAGGAFVAVWRDGTGGQLRATRIGIDGSVLDPASIRVAGYPPVAWTPSVAGRDGSYRVVYESGGSIYTTTLSSDGTAGQATKILPGCSLPRVASSAAGTIVAARTFEGIRIAALDAAGTVAHEAFIPARMFDGPRVVPLGDAFLVVWAQEAPNQPMPAIEALIVTGGGELVDQARIVAAQGSAPAVASVGDRALVTWQRPDPSSANAYALASNVFGRIVTTTTLSDELTIAAVSEPAIGDVSIAAHRGEFTVVWTQLSAKVPAWHQEGPPWTPSYDLYGTAVSPAGEVRSAGQLVHGEDSAENPELVSNGQRLLLSWTDHCLTSGRMRIAAGLLLDIVAPVEQLDIALSASNQENPRVATTDGVTLVTWTEDPSNAGSAGLYVRRLDRSGQFLDEKPREWSGGEELADTTSVAPGLSGFGIAWKDKRGGSFVRRMGIDGTHIDAVPLRVGDSGMMTSAIASDGANYAVLTIEGGMLSAAVIRASGSVEHRTLIPYAAPGWTPVALAWDGTRFVAALPFATETSTSIGVVTRQQINVIAFSRDGALLSGPTAVTSGNEDHTNPSLACANGSCLLAWYGWSGINTALLFGPDRVTQLGPLTSAQAYFPKVMNTADGFNVVWTTFDGGTTELHLQPLGGDGFKAGAEIVLARFDGAASTDVTTNPAGNCIIGYSSIVEGQRYGGTKRVFVRAPATGRRRAVAQ